MSPDFVIVTFDRFECVAVMNTCAECRFWKQPSEPLTDAPKQVGIIEDPRDWRACEAANSPMGTIGIVIRYDSKGWPNDGGEIVTRSDFGCVQFERKPIDLKNIPVGQDVVTVNTGGTA